ncbi:hypothetical protein Cpir12675_005800 [Ceratocystis pirilliformis]|uniref:Uncharacterized protein n=1 Tax=Ceratocystis pirilliformis TaxID=259994 RepID=A0ABR3YN02_9PEZI
MRAKHIRHKFNIKELQYFQLSQVQCAVWTEVYLHGYLAFFGQFADVANICCEDFPPVTTPEELEDQIYIREPLTFIFDDPGRQQIGLLNPLTAED